MTNPVTARELFSLRRLAKPLVAAGYLVVSIVAAWWFGGYLQAVGGTDKVSYALYLAFGPFIALAQGHGVAIYLMTTVFVLPLLIAAVGGRRLRHFAYFMSAAVIWVAVGAWMHGG